MRTNSTGLGIIKSYESLRLEAYHCKLDPNTEETFCTIGYGSTRYADESPVKEGDIINRDIAETLFEYHVQKCEDAIAGSIMVPVTDNEFSAMVSLCYNIGTGAFKKSTLLKMLNNKEPREDVANQFLQWNKAGGKVMAGLCKRREAERQLFLKQ